MSTEPTQSISVEISLPGDLNSWEVTHTISSISLRLHSMYQDYCGGTLRLLTVEQDGKNGIEIRQIIEDSVRTSIAILLHFCCGVNEDVNLQEFFTENLDLSELLQSIISKENIDEEEYFEYEEDDVEDDNEGQQWSMN